MRTEAMTRRTPRLCNFAAQHSGEKKWEHTILQQSICQKQQHIAYPKHTQLTCQSSNEAENANLFCKAITILHEK